jgi:hypothetical protein
MRTELREGEELFIAIGDGNDFVVTVECNYRCYRRLCRALLPVFSGDFDDAAECAALVVFSVLCPAYREMAGSSCDRVLDQLKRSGFDLSKHAGIDLHAEWFVDPAKVCLALCRFSDYESDFRLFRRMN